MNDAYYEQLVARKSRPLDMVIRFLTILVIQNKDINFLPFVLVIHKSKKELGCD